MPLLFVPTTILFPKFYIGFLWIYGSTTFLSLRQQEQQRTTIRSLTDYTVLYKVVLHCPSCLYDQTMLRRLRREIVQIYSNLSNICLICEDLKDFSL